jgi:hypothetical protein
MHGDRLVPADDLNARRCGVKYPYIFFSPATVPMIICSRRSRSMTPGRIVGSGSCSWVSARMGTVELLVVEAIAAVVLLLGFDVLTRSRTRVRVSRVLVWGTLILALAISMFVSYGSFFGLRVFAPPLSAVLVFEIYDYVRHRSMVQAIHPNGIFQR